MPQALGVFVWRNKLSQEVWDTDSADYATYIDNEETEYEISGCKWCSGPIEVTEGHSETHESQTCEMRCLACGYHENSEETYARRDSNEPLLREFDLNSSDLSFSEVASFLRRNGDAIRSFSPRRFEEFVAYFFKTRGYSVSLTKQTRDGGYDVLLLDKEGAKTIVEVKRWSQPIGVGLVRELRGVQVAEGANEAVLVTSSRFSSDARIEAESERAIEIGLRMSLMDANDILKELEVFSSPAFGLEDLNRFRKEMRDKIMRSNSAVWRK